MILLIKLLLAHFIGDFYLQPKNWVEEKENKKLKSPKLYLHIVIHVLVTSLLLWDMSLWPLVIIIGVSHFIIDATKLVVQKENTKRLWFFIDQFLHIIVIIVCYFSFSENILQIENIITENNLLLLVCLLFLTVPVSIIMKT